MDCHVIKNNYMEKIKLENYERLALLFVSNHEKLTKCDLKQTIFVFYYCLTYGS